LPKANGIPYIPRPLTFADNIITYTVGSRVQKTPLYQYADSITWTRGAGACQRASQEHRNGHHYVSARRRDLFRRFRSEAGPQPGHTVTTANSTNLSNSALAIADATGNLVFVNPAPGDLSNLQKGYFRGPASLSFDMSLSKRVLVSETKSVEFRMDAVNVLNRPNWGAPNVNINNTNFGRITTATGNRTFTANLRVNF
jgi:hypothetical protein